MQKYNQILPAGVVTPLSNYVSTQAGSRVRLWTGNARTIYYKDADSLPDFRKRRPEDDGWLIAREGMREDVNHEIYLYSAFETIFNVEVLESDVSGGDMSGIETQLNTIIDLLSAQITPKRLNAPLFGNRPIIYEDIKDAVDAGAIAKLGNPDYDATTYDTPAAYYSRRIYKYGGNNEADGDGAEIAIPDGYTVAWVRILSDRWNSIKAYMLDGAQEQLGHFGGGYRRMRNYQPDSGMRHGNHSRHEWLPISVGRAGRLALISKPHTNSRLWLSGVAFSTNPINLASKTAVIAHWNCDPAGGTQYRGNSGVKWHRHDWQRDQLASIKAKTVGSVMLPVVPNGKDKAIYIVLHNNLWDELLPKTVTVNGQQLNSVVWRHRDTPLERWYSKSQYARVVVMKVDAALVGNDHMLRVDFDMNGSAAAVYFREVGTHDWI